MEGSVSFLYAWHQKQALNWKKDLFNDRCSLKRRNDPVVDSRTCSLRACFNVQHVVTQCV